MARRYYDEQGNELDPSTLDPNEYEIIEADAPPPRLEPTRQSSFLSRFGDNLYEGAETAGQQLLSGLTSAGAAITGGVEAIDQLARNTHERNPFIAPVSDELIRMRDKLQADIAAKNPWFAEKLVGGLLQSIPSMKVIQAAGGPLTAATAMGGMGAAEKYAELGANEEVAPEDRSLGALTRGFSDAITSYPSLRLGLKPNTGVGDVVKAVGVDAALNPLQVLGDVAATKVGTGEVTEDPYDIARRMVEASAMGALPTALIGAASIKKGRAETAAAQAMDPVVDSVFNASALEESVPAVANPTVDMPPPPAIAAPDGPFKPAVAPPVQDIAAGIDPTVLADTEAYLSPTSPMLPVVQQPPLIDGSVPPPATNLTKVAQQIQQETPDIETQQYRVRAEMKAADAFAREAARNAPAVTPEPAIHLLPKPDAPVATGELYTSPFQRTEGPKVGNFVGDDIRVKLSSILKRAMSERGSVAPELLGISKGRLGTEPSKTNMEQKVSDSLTTARDIYEGIRAAATGNLSEFKDLDALTQKASGGDIPGVRNIKQKIFAGTRQLSNMANIDAPTKEFVSMIDNVYRGTKNAFLWDSEQLRAPIANLDNAGQKKVAQVLYRLRHLADERIKQGQPVPIMTAAEYKAMGLNDAEVNAATSLREFYDKSLDTLEEGLLAKQTEIPEARRPEYVQAVQEFKKNMQGRYYVPNVRTGAYYKLESKAKSPSGKEYVSYSAQFDSKTDALRAQPQIEKEIGTPVTLKRVPPDLGYKTKNIPTEMMDLDESFSPLQFTAMVDRLGVTGFVERLTRANLTPGYDLDIVKTTERYAQGLANFTSMKKLRAGTLDLLKRSAKDPTRGLTQEDMRHPRTQIISKALDDLETPDSPVASAFGSALNMWYLGATPITMLAQATPMLNIVTPEAISRFSAAGKRFGSAEVRGAAASAKGAATAAQYAFKAAGNKNYGKGKTGIMDYLYSRDRMGLVGHPFTDEISNKARGKSTVAGTSFTDALMVFTAVGERMQRLQAAATGYKVGEAIGLKDVDLHNYADDFLRATAEDPTKVNAPPFMSKGMPRVLTMFKRPIIAQLNFAKKALSDKDFKKLVYMMGANVAMGGVASLAPFTKDIMNVLESFGYSVKQNITKALNNSEYADFLNYGVSAAPYAPKIHASAGTQDIIPDIDKDPYVALSKTLLGVPGAWVADVARGTSLIAEGKTGLGLERLAPRALRNTLKTIRGLNEGKLTDAGGNTSIKNFDGWDAMTVMSGASPLESSKYYSVKTYENRITKRFEKQRSSINQRIADSITGDGSESIDKLIDEAMELGIMPNLTSIKERIASKSMPDSMRVMKEAPKPLRREILDSYERLVENPD